MIDPEEFAAWKENPVTQWVLKAYEQMAAEQHKAWNECSWEGGHCDSFVLQELRVRADAYRSMAESNLEDLAAAHEPEAE